MTSFSYRINNDHIAILTFDIEGEKVNKLTTRAMDELDAVLRELAGKKDVKALVFRSGKPESFIVGADISEIRDIRDASTGETLAHRGQEVFNLLENLPFPTVAAIHGACMGGGMELALACSYRVISNDQKTALALPEVKLGIIPGFGGTQRLPRLVGLANALDLILTGKSVYAKKAEKIGLADEVTYKEILLDRAIVMAKKKTGKPSPTAIRARRPLLIRLLESNALTRSLLFTKAKKTVLSETRGNYPAPLAALDSVHFGLTHTGKEGYRNEARLLGMLAPTEVSKNLISVFYLNETLRKNASPSPVSITNAGVLGAGVMGGGIAQLFAEKGISVRMKDISAKAVTAGLKEASGIFTKRRKKGILTPIQARDGFDRITGATDYTGFSHADVAVEAVVEIMDVKKSVLREFEQNSNEYVIYASNTSSLSITEMAAASKRPERVAGMHFFNPVEKMPLIEVVRGAKTSEDTVSAIAALSRKLGKLPVIVNDGPGFLVNRILMPYLNEAVLLLDEGSRIDEVDRVLLQFGMPMGAFILIDEIGIDISHKVADILHAGLGERVKPAPLLGILHKDGYLGKKNGRGFYLYTGRTRGGPDASIYGKVAVKSGAGGKKTEKEIIDRPVLLMIKEAALCLEETIISAPDLLDAALIFGIGFPPFRGGLLRYADSIGAQALVAGMERYAALYGDRFAPPASLVAMAKMGKRFYP